MPGTAVAEVIHPSGVPSDASIFSDVQFPVFSANNSNSPFLRYLAARARPFSSSPSTPIFLVKVPFALPSQVLPSSEEERTPGKVPPAKMRPLESETKESHLSR